MSTERSIVLTEAFGLIALITIGMLFHELYKSTDITLLSFISPVNESKWEHMKMALCPMIIVASLEYLVLRGKVHNYIFALAIGILAFQIVTFGLIELYELIYHDSHLLVHITTFILGAIFGQVIRYQIMLKLAPSKKLLFFGIALIGIQIIVFSIFTFYPPKYDYFMDSLSKTYGINRD